MYTLVLMTAMAGGPEATRFDGWGGGGCYSACYGTSCLGASTACYGSCYGGPLFPRARALFSGLGDGLRGAFAPLGSYRSWGCCGGYASCSGCFGSCHGCGGCFGSGFGSCHGCFGGGVYYGSAVYGGCYGSSVAVGCHGCVGYSAVLPSIPAVPFAGEAPAAAHVAMKPAATDPTAASLVVSLPAAAKLYVDGQLVAGDGPSRRFHTPPLTAGQNFYYELKAEVLVGGKVETEETKVVIRAGDTKDVAFGKLAALVQPAGSLAAR